MSVFADVLDRDCEDMPGVSPDQFRSGMRLFAAGCTVIATAANGQRAGLTATAVCSVSAEPPLLLACVNKRVYAHGLIEQSRALSVNILGLSAEPTARAFAGMEPSLQGEERFSVGDWRTGKSGAPILAGAIVAMDCVVVNSVSEGSHSIFICRVVDVVNHNNGAPLLYYDGKFCSISAE